jgi:hypothetical protein
MVPDQMQMHPMHQMQHVQAQQQEMQQLQLQQQLQQRNQMMVSMLLFFPLVVSHSWCNHLSFWSRWGGVSL